MTLTGKLLSLLGASCLVAFASAVPASAATKPCCFNGGQYFNSTPTTCNRYGGRVVPQEYCDRNYNGYNERYSRQEGGALFARLLTHVVFGYSDGYYDYNRRWHRWRNDQEHDWYRQNRRQSYHHMRRYQDRDQYRRDWLRGRRADWRSDRGGGDTTFSISLGNVVFGYSDGYYDNNRRWYDWRNDEERDWYRQNHGQTYYEMRRDGDNHRGRREWREGRRDNWRDDGYHD